MTPYVAGYVRKSSASGDRPGDDSKDAQEAAIRRLCPDVERIFTDWGISGAEQAIDKRKGYQELKREISAGRVSAVCVSKLDRLGRDVMELLSFVKVCVNAKPPVSVRIADTGLDATDPGGELMFTVLAALARWESRTGQARARTSRVEKVARHEAEGLATPGNRPRYGWLHEACTNGEGKRLWRRVPDPAVAADVARVVAAYGETGSLQGTAKVLNGEHVPTPSGEGRWAAAMVRRVLEDQKALMPKGATNRRVPEGREPARFRGLLRCHCGYLLTPVVGPRKQGVRYYCSHAAQTMGPEERAEHGQYWRTEGRLMAELAPYAAEAGVAAPEQSARFVEQERERLEDDRRLLGVSLRARTITEDAFNREIAALDARIAKLPTDQPTVRTFTVVGPIDLAGDPLEVNAALRQVWRSVQLGPGLSVERVEWYRFADPAISAAQERVIERLNAERGPDQDLDALTVEIAAKDPEFAADLAVIRGDG